MTPLVQEALSLKYSNAIVILVPLSDGGVAVFNAARELQAILSAATSLHAAINASIAPKEQETVSSCVGEHVRTSKTVITLDSILDMMKKEI